jgi:DNA polymerase III subunit gamma/tau
MSWYLKYRPRQISDLDLARVREQLLGLMDSGKFPQTFLFAGPKGTGKTSASRIIGAMLNDPKNQKAVESIFLSPASTKKNTSLKEPDPKSDFAQRVFRGQSLVVQEMDAASHRGIDDIRQLKERIYIPPQEGSMAVYILDEVHMLTNEAFNALLKILEEPPPHVVFILATTELHKVPPTIVSRCNLITFYKASSQEIIDRLKKILKQEKTEFEEDALLEIARRSDGSFRDAVKLTEMASQDGDVSLEKVDQLIGGSALVEVKKLISSVLDKDEKQICQFFISLRQRNFDEDYFVKSLLSYLHQNLLGSLGVIDFEAQLDPKVSQFLLKAIIEVDLQQTSPIPFLPLELSLLALVQKAKKSRPDSGSSGGSDSGNSSTPSAGGRAKAASPKEEMSASEEVADIQERVFEAQETDQDPLATEDVASLLDETDGEMVAGGDPSLSQSLCERWQEFVKLVEGQNSTLAALLRSGQPYSGSNGVAQVKVFYRFHQEQLQQPKLRRIVEECGEKIVGDKISFKFVLTSPPSEAEVVEVPAETQDLEALAEEALM